MTIVRGRRAMPRRRRVRRVSARSRVRTVLAMSLLPAALATGCGGDDDETLPAIDQRSASDPSNSAGRPSRTDRSGGSLPAAAPQGADLAPDEQAAYDKAVDDLEKFAKAAERLSDSPTTDKATYQTVHKLAFDPYATQYLAKLQRFEEHDIEVHGRTDLLWRVPVRVNLDARWPVVVWKECTGDGSIRVFNGGERVPQTDKTPFSSKLKLRVDSDGTWRPFSSKDTGPCAAH